MTEFFQQLLPVTALATLLSSAVILVLNKLLPDVFGRWIILRLEHKNNVAIERVRVDFNSKIQAYQNSFLASIEAVRSISPKSMEAVENLWNNLISASEHHKDLTFLFEAFTKLEIEDAARSKDARLWPTIKKFNDADKIFSKEIFAIDAQKARIYVSDKLYNLYNTSLSLRVRAAYEVHLVASGKQETLSPTQLICIATRLLPREKVEKYFTTSKWDLNRLIHEIDAEFLRESRTILYGSEHLSNAMSSTQLAIAAFEASSQIDAIKD